MAGDYVLDGFAVPDELDKLHALLTRAGEEHPDVSASDLMLFETAVTEVANNVIEHGVPTGGVHWTFTLDVDPGELQAVLRENGQAFTGDLHGAMPDDPLSESGRGLPLADTVLDELEYVRDGSDNVWRMVRRRTGGE
ncbi:ATP-binding protein [Nocardioides sp. KR10-350]|uniref:ATP-binding protein n=1 Tax=Nocardioides cheoyonin TaxID=3156615 RepID=UPI0032B37B7C